LGEKRDPSERHANSNLHNLTHITQKPSHVYTFFTYTLKEITALGCMSMRCPNQLGFVCKGVGLEMGLR